jgi:hypothetical protein
MWILLYPILYLNKFVFLFFITICTCCNAIAQRFSVKIIDKPNYTINQKKYDTASPLTWADFKKLMPDTMAYAALTVTNIHSGYSMKHKGNEMQVIFTTQLYFDRSKSVKTNKGMQYDVVLKHEQVHFDIAYYHYTLLKKELAITTFTKDNYKSLFYAVVDKHSKNSVAMQAAYDTETNHSLIEEKQKEWNEKVKELLLSLY